MVSGAALSFTAILFLNASPAQLGLLRVADLLPKFLAGLVAGVWVDRLRRRPIMVAADIGRALLLVTIPAAALLHQLRIELLYAVALLTGLLTLFFDIANRSYLPTLIRREELVEGNSKLTASASVAEFGGFSLAGWLVQWLTGPIAVLVDAVSFLFSALFLGMIRAPEPPPVPHGEQQGMRQEIVEGLQAVRREPILLSLAVTTLNPEPFGGDDWHGHRGVHGAHARVQSRHPGDDLGRRRRNLSARRDGGRSARAAVGSSRRSTCRAFEPSNAPM